MVHIPIKTQVQYAALFSLNTLCMLVSCRGTNFYLLSTEHVTGYPVLLSSIGIKST